MPNSLPVDSAAVPCNESTTEAGSPGPADDALEVDRPGGVICDDLRVMCRRRADVDRLPTETGEGRNLARAPASVNLRYRRLPPF